MNAVAKIEQHNPIGTDGFEFVEFTAPTPRASSNCASCST